jgi:branched-chain amino acid aminotransferase
VSVIPFDDRDGEIWLDGEFVPWRDARVHVLTHGLHYASSVFEGLRVYDGAIFKLQEHSERLHRSAELLDMVIPYSVDVLNQACRDAVARNSIKNGYIRPVAWSGSEMMAISARQNKVHVAVAAWEWGSYFDPAIKAQGLKLRTSSWRRPSPETAPCASKAAGLYMICTMSKHQAEREGFHDALMLDYRGYIAEATGANIFLVMANGEIHTPTPDCFLDGITRRTVIDLARQAGFTLVERHIQPEELANAKEVFLTGTAAEITPVGSIDDYRFTVGEVTHRLIADYTALVHSAA